MKKSTLIILTIVFVGGLVFSGVSLKPAEAAGKITLNLVSFVPGAVTLRGTGQVKEFRPSNIQL